MILEEYKQDNFYKEIDLNILTEDTIRLVTNLLSNFEDVSALDEYYSYIDNLIDYFSHKKNMYLRYDRNMIDKIYSYRRELLKNNKEKIKVRVIYSKYKHLPKYEKYIPDKFIMEWNFNKNKKSQSYNNVTSKVYSKIIKNITDGEIDKFSHIDNFIYKISYEKELYKDEIKKQMDNVNIPHDIMFINQYIDAYIKSLNSLKEINIHELDNENNEDKLILNAIKMIEIKTNYVKCNLNIFFNLYLNKLKVYIPYINNFSELLNLNETIYNVFNNTDRLLSEAEWIENGYDKKELKLIDGNHMYWLGETLDGIEYYIKTIYDSCISHLNKYYNYEALKYLEYFNIYNNKYLFMQVNDIQNYKEFIENEKNYFMMKLEAPYTRLDHNYDRYDREVLIKRINQRDRIFKLLTNDYNSIIDYINKLKNINITAINSDNEFSYMFERYYKDLGLYLTDERLNIKEKLNSYGIDTDKIPIRNERYGDYIYKILINSEDSKKIERLIERYKQLQNKIGEDNFIISNPIGVHVNKEDFPNDLKLLAYIIYFRNKALNIMLI